VYREDEANGITFLIPFPTSVLEELFARNNSHSHPINEFLPARNDNETARTLEVGTVVNSNGKAATQTSGGSQIGKQKIIKATVDEPDQQKATNNIKLQNGDPAGTTVYDVGFLFPGTCCGVP
jgi:hypothetical protein